MYLVSPDHPVPLKRPLVPSHPVLPAHLTSLEFLKSQIYFPVLLRDFLPRPLPELLLLTAPSQYPIQLLLTPPH